MTNKGSKKLNYTTASPPTTRSPRVSTLAHTKNLVIIVKRKNQTETQTQIEKG